MEARHFDGTKPWHGWFPGTAPESGCLPHPEVALLREQLEDYKKISRLKSALALKLMRERDAFAAEATYLKEMLSPHMVGSAEESE